MGTRGLGNGAIDRSRSIESAEPPQSERRLLIVGARASNDGPGGLSARRAKPVTPEFDAAFRAHAPHLRRIAQQVLGSGEEVDDVVQDVFIRAHQRLHELRNAAALRSWLGTITVRVARRRLRSTWFKRVWRGDDAVGFELPDPGATPEQYSMVASFNRYLQRLPEDQRLAWVLCEVEGKTLPEAARISECSLSTVTRRLQAAKSRIRKAMRD